MAWDCGAGHYFDLLIRCRLVLNIFPFPVSKAKLITIGEALRTGVRALPILLCSLCCANTVGATIRTRLIGEARQIWKIREKLIIAAANSPRFAYWRSEGAPLRL